MPDRPRPLRALGRAEVREFDRRAVEDYGVPGVVLMENAGRSAAELLLSLGVSEPIVLCCGKGNNGGDGFVIARHLQLRGCDARVLLFCQPGDLRGDAKVNYEILAKARFPISVHSGPTLAAETLQPTFAEADWIVDALFGTGLEGAVRPPLDRVIELVNSSGRKVLAVDIPSGLDCDTGMPLGATIRATHTVTFVAMKKGFLQPSAEAYTGQVHIADIGVPRRLWGAFSD
jgi:NAD(P)H-hydrate epimerase